ncbi:MAG: L-serine ammonia-lyase, iron-sulfur-dependent subunit beta [Oscillospiraceae bacterium]|nr:L-serine ammonia-lyase, iron-sulfur-dependent subunit beta [Oscillospiraceae bacterium]
MSIFNVTGPVTIGPSSSHTAGAVRIGSMARTLLDDEPARAKIYLHGSFAETAQGHGTELALVSGLLGMKTDDIRIPFAFEEAEKAGLEFSFEEIELREAHPNTAVLKLWGKHGKTLTIQASSTGGGRIRVNRLDGIDVNFNGNYNTLVIHNQDHRGHIADVTAALSIAQVNVANMSLHRNKRGGDALMIIETDQSVPQAVRDLLSRLPGIIKLTYYDKTREEADENGTKLYAGDFRSDGEIR